MLRAWASTAAAFAAFLLFPSVSWAQSNVYAVIMCKNSTTGVEQQCNGSTDAGLPVSAVVTASVTGFTGTTSGTPFTATTGGATGTLPAGVEVVVSNAGATNTAFCALGASASTSSQPIPPNSWFGWAVGASTQVSCVTSTSTTTINTLGGSGLPTGAGGGGGGGGGGGAVTLASGAVASGAYSSGAYASGSIASGAVASGAFASGALAAGSGTDGWNVTEGTKADSAYAGSGSASIVAALKGIYAAVTGAIPAGSATIGAVTQASGPWTVNLTQLNSAALGSPSNYGTSPGAVEVQGVNAYVTNTPAVTGTVTSQFSTANAATTPHICGSRVYKHITTATDTQIVAASGSTTIYVCDYSFSANAADNIYLEKATSGTCATLTQIDQQWYLAANEAKTDAKPFYTGLNTGASAQLCVNTSAAVSFDIAVNYDQY